MPEWDADVVIDEALVRALLAEQFPQLDAGSARLLGEGWDNSVWVVEDRWAFRFPRREIAIPGVERELEVLPRLVPLLPVAVPVPTFVGQPSDRFRWPFFGAPLLPGREPAYAELSEEARTDLGTQLGRFLRALHDVELDMDLPDDPIRRADMPFRVARMREKLAAIDELGVWSATPAVGRILADAERLPPSTDRVLAHGDLHFRHVLIHGGELSGVIDWGDVCRSDPAVDLMLLWSLLSPSGRARFGAEYGPIDGAGRLRARVLALFLGATLAIYAHGVGDADLERECVASLERTLVD